MKKKFVSLLLAALLLFALTGCKGKFKTELPMQNIKSMICTGEGDVFLLSDLGLRRYNLSSDKDVVYIYNTEDLADAVFDLYKNGTHVKYTGIYIDRLLPQGDTGVVMAAKYTENDLGWDDELFVLQDAADLNFSAAYFTGIEKSDSGFLNGVAADSSGLYFKLNAPVEEGVEYYDGIKYNFFGQTYPYAMPDGVTGAIKTGGEDDDTSCFLVETKTSVGLTDGETVIKTFNRSKVADAFVSGDSVYVIYKDGQVTKTGVDGNEEDFMKLSGSVSNVNDAFLYEDELYWFDKEGIKTSAK